MAEREQRVTPLELWWAWTGFAWLTNMLEPDSVSARIRNQTRRGSRS